MDKAAVLMSVFMVVKFWFMYKCIQGRCQTFTFFQFSKRFEFGKVK